MAENKIITIISIGVGIGNDANFRIRHRKCEWNRKIS